MTRAHQIVLVEDSPTQAVRLQWILEKEGWEVVWAPTAQQAIDEIDRCVPDLVLIDYYLPGVRGDELCRRIRMHIDTRNIPILMMTAEESDEVEIRGLESGADDFVPKSVDPDILLVRIRTLLGKAKQRSAILGTADARFRHARLLMIDDSPTYLEYLREELGKDGYHLASAGSGSEGVQRIVHEHFDCALVDLVMPAMDGIEVCRRINELRATTDNPVALLMLTARENKEDLTRALEAGADDFVGKSSDVAVLKGRIRALLRRKFFQEENQRIQVELKNKELEAVRARAETELAEARLSVLEELERTAAELRRSKDELSLAKDKLEERVRERTAAIAETNARLQAEIIERRSAEQALRKSAAELAEAIRDLTHKNQENEMFVYSVSHDLRSPLVNLQGFSNELGKACTILRDLLADERIVPEIRAKANTLLETKFAKSLGFIQNAVLRLANIIDALLRLSRAGRVEYRWQVVDANRIAAQILASLNATITEKRVIVQMHNLPSAWSDATAFEQLLANLIGNAINYLDPKRGGMVEIGHVAPTERNFTPEFVTYFVKDNGLGIAPVHHDKIFQIFQRFHSGAAKGEGIGLSIVARIVERHRGKIWVESQEGAGSTFFVSLPSRAA